MWRSSALAMFIRCGGLSLRIGISNGVEAVRVAIVGCGLIGRKRLRSLGKAHQLVIAADVAPERAVELAAAVPGAIASGRWEDAVGRPDVDAVLVATTNQWLAPV